MAVASQIPLMLFYHPCDVAQSDALIRIQLDGRMLEARAAIKPFFDLEGILRGCESHRTLWHARNENAKGTIGNVSIVSSIKTPRKWRGKYSFMTQFSPSPRPVLSIIFAPGN